MNEKVIKNWISLAEYDFQTAKAMLGSGRYLYVAFTCQQTIEKILKAIYVKEKGITPPYTHNLIKLLTALSFSSNTDDKKNKFIELLNSYYIESRYTEEINEMSNLLNKKKVEEIFLKTGDLFQWLKKMI